LWQKSCRKHFIAKMPFKCFVLAHHHQHEDGANSMSQAFDVFVALTVS